MQKNHFSITHDTYTFANVRMTRLKLFAGGKCPGLFWERIGYNNKGFTSFIHWTSEETAFSEKNKHSL
jgi:hypothetical protein